MGTTRLPAVQVTFTVKQGGGRIGGQATFSTVSDGDGASRQCSVRATEGQDNNIVEATFVETRGIRRHFWRRASAGQSGQYANTGWCRHSNHAIPA